jgi:prepilin-type N-terminal cleavage/methylation domain-containing protein
MRSPNRGFSLLELLVVIAAIVVVLTVAIPNLLKAKLSATETMVLREVQTIGQAEIQYASLFGKYAATLAELGPPATGIAGPQAAELIPGKLASGEKNGYLYTLTLTSTGFAVSASPKEFGNTGRRTFYLDQSGVVHQNWGREPATANSPEL